MSPISADIWHTPTVHNSEQVGKNSLGAQPKYRLHSVDNVLELLQMLRDRGPVRVSTAARNLGVSRSTVHRLLQMLVYRGFAIQDEDRVYVPGPGMNVAPVQSNRVNSFLFKAKTHFQNFVSDMGETVSLVARYGATLRFIDTYVPQDVAAISSRRGQILPAHETSGGKILLSYLDGKTLEHLYHSERARRGGTYLETPEFNALLKQLATAKIMGYAINPGRTERDVYALGMAIDEAATLPWLAFAVAVPYSRRSLITDRWFLRECHLFKQSLAAIQHEEDSDI